MATTIFPQTDDVVTRTAWQSLHSTISHGDDPGYSQSDPDGEDTDRIKITAENAGPTADDDTTKHYVSTISLDAGHTYYVRGCISFNKVLPVATDDELELGLSIGSGLTTYGASFLSQKLLSSGQTTITSQNHTGPTDATLTLRIVGTYNVNFTDAVCWIDMLVVADQDADLSWFYVKRNDDYLTRYRAWTDTYLLATPIKG